VHLDMAMLTDLKTLIVAVGYVGLFLIVFAESGLLFGFFLPGDSLLFTAGFLASPAGKAVLPNGLDVQVLIPLLFVAAVLGDAVGYSFGLRVGRRLFLREDSLFFHKRNLLKAEAFYQRHGGKAIVLARFLPAIRTFAPIVAGVAAMRYRDFAIYNFLGAALWTGSMTLGGYFLGSIIPDPDKYLLPIVLLIIVLSAMPTAIHMFKESRGELAARLRRRLRPAQE
jgi:membrane-associated protein